MEETQQNYQDTCNNKLHICTKISSIGLTQVLINKENLVRQKTLKHILFSTIKRNCCLANYAKSFYKLKDD